MSISKKGIDQVCGMTVEVQESTSRLNYKGKEY